ncbi:hypothetical protein CONCODRAFT_19508 [Conidiobolus coronatus NRRL 28638]|uniref:Uncharacterized protein n=1 Tax=Conidiobolus coronatus (strain ATCC 28846 / CBS 209.66 / NRRL 28638) TaxID=796925 RepID=A0A137NY49_CONC2|nr:hypothetical protein CONCODRAFT_19508 [Conidiobolus coronatus NRRL 28638]|eukprot:KXN67591.1 hypothetical protein CONCODRAFT_19508 [Conidiobolus coronatus NRRL 28638]
MMKLKLQQLTQNLKLSHSNLLVSSPHPVSNLRLLKFSEKFKLNNELEREYKNRIEYMQTLGHNFWYENNLKYQREKLEFEANILKQNREPNKDDYTIFYNNFLTSNAQSHKNFHISWVKECFKLIVPSLKFNLSRVYSAVVGENTNTSNNLNYFNSNN